MDEFLVFSMLSYMDPVGLDFNPRGRFTYGGSYVYPLGGVLFFLKSLGFLHLTRDLSYYLKHPCSIETMYIAGRSIGVLSFLESYFS